MDLDRLLEIGDRCIHDEPPPCTAACPVHMDVIGFMTEIENGDFSKAYKLMEKKLPFAGIIGMICDHPCESCCVRQEPQDAIAISELEKAVIALGYAPPKRNIPIPKNKGRVAVAGGGLSGLTAACDLDKKGYQVVIYEKEDRIGGRIWKYEGANLGRETILEQLGVIEKNGIRVELNTILNESSLNEIVREYDAVFLGTGEWEKEIHADPDTFQVGDSSIFAGGRLVSGSDSVIHSVSTGRRAAISIDRYVGKVSLGASREREGVFDTLLQYKVDAAEVSTRTKKTAAQAAGGSASDVYSRDEASAEAGRCLKCRCDLCIRGCSHMQRFKISPDSYIRQINHNERIILGTHYANQMINSCTRCGLCREQCFLDIGMNEIIEETRISMVSKGKMPPSAHDFALRDMQFSNSSRFSMVKGLPKGSGANGYLFYPGCQLSATHSESIPGIYRHLEKIIPPVGIYLGCCGAPADWAGRQDLVEENIAGIRQVWADNEHPVFILACPSCMAVFEKYLPEIKTTSLWEILDRYGLPERHARAEGLVLNIHDACTARYRPQVQESIRNIAASLGCSIREPAYTREKTKCCGYGGLVYYANRDQAEDFVRDRIGECQEDLLVYCAMCRDLFAGGGKRTYHILDLICCSDLEAAALRKKPTLSERQFNRSKLKRSLLEELLEETREKDHEPDYDFNLIIPEPVAAVMEERYILEEEVGKVIDHGRKKGERFFNPENSNYLARLRLEHITDWVRYEEKGREVFVNSVYSHRMKAVEEETEELGGKGKGQEKKTDTAKQEKETAREKVKEAKAEQEKGTAWLCDKCRKKLTPGKVKMRYLDANFEVELMKCPSCNMVLVEEDLALGRMLEVEKSLEDK